MITSEAWATMPSIVKQATVRATLTKISSQVNRAAQSEGFERSNAHLSRTTLTLDQRGWNELATRAELRCPDPACNPYLAFAVMLSSGLDGIEKGYDLPDPVEKDIFKMTPQQLEAHGISSLPENLGLAIKETENSELVRRTLGNHVFDRLIELKKKEWNDYRIQVSQYELERYLPVL